MENVFQLYHFVKNDYKIKKAVKSYIKYTFKIAKGTNSVLP
jgi:hypothetical protein